MSNVGRCVAVWGAATAAAALLVAWLLPGSVAAVSADPGGFIDWLVAGCAWAAAGGAVWLWVLTTWVVADALRGRPARAAVPSAVRRVVLAACGLALAGGLVVPAHADGHGGRPESATTQSLLVGLPLPDRATSTTEWIGALSTAPAGPGSPVQATTTPPEDVVQVRPGDTLWEIARDSLSPAAPAAEIDRRWREIYRANRDVVGADPDLIRPGQRLQLPPSGSPR